MNFDDFYGLSASVKRLQEEFRSEQGVHAYLLLGPRGTGKKSIATLCARALNCVGAQKPCGHCPPCERALAGTHPDIIVLKKEGASIGVDEVRTLIARVAIKPYEGGMHAVIIEDADSMTQQAQNALLKTLETPPSSAVFFLIAEALIGLLPTIRSRCRIVRVSGIEDAAMKQALIAHGIEPLRIDALISVADGSVGRALALSADKDYWALRDKAIEALKLLKKPADVSRAVALLKDSKGEASSVLAILEQLARDKLRADEGLAKALTHIHPRGDKLLSAVIRARERANSNVIWQNVLENLFMDVAGL